MILEWLIELVWRSELDWLNLFLLSKMQQIINNWETGLAVRTKLNAMFQELYGTVIEQELILAHSAVPISVTGTNTEVWAYILVIPAGTFLPDSTLNIEVMTGFTGGWTLTPRIKINWVTVQSVAHTSTQLGKTSLFKIKNRGVLNSQIATPAAQDHPYQWSTVAYNTYSINTANLMTVEITLQLSVPANTWRIDSVLVSILK